MRIKQSYRVFRSVPANRHTQDEQLLSDQTLHKTVVHSNIMPVSEIQVYDMKTNASETSYPIRKAKQSVYLKQVRFTLYKDM